MASIYYKPKQDSLCRTGLEVYKTDEEHFKPYTSAGASRVSSEDSEDNSNSDKGYSLHRANMLETYYYANLESTSHEYDYSDMNHNGSFKLQNVDKYRFYKGVRLKLLKGWEAPSKQLQWDDLPTVMDGFITDQSFSENGVEVKISGMTKLLDEKFKFNFTDMKRSKILAEIIRTAGLIPVIKTKGLDDDVTSFTTKSSDSSSSGSSVGEGEDINNFVKGIIGNETDELKKLKKIHSTLVKKVKYTRYECSRYENASDCLKSLKLNCADSARLAAACYRSAGLKVHCVHGDYHFWTIVTANGEKYASDVSGHHDLNEVWSGKGHHNTAFSGKNCGDNPDC